MLYKVFKSNRCIDVLSKQEIISKYGYDPCLFLHKMTDSGLLFAEVDDEMTGIEAQNDVDFADEEMVESDFEEISNLYKIYHE